MARAEHASTPPVVKKQTPRCARHDGGWPATTKPSPMCRGLSAFVHEEDNDYLHDVRVRLHHILLGLTVSAYALGALAGNNRTSKSLHGTALACQRLATAEKSRPSDSRPVWSECKCIPSSTKVEFHPATPLLADPFQHRQDFIILPRASCTLLPVRCVYVRFLPRDPPSA